MKLLFDHNLSFRLVSSLADVYPECATVDEHGLSRAADEAVWQFAAKNAFAIVSKDSDFRQRSFMLGPPPKVIWIATGICSTPHLEALLRAAAADIRVFLNEPASALLVLR